MNRQYFLILFLCQFIWNFHFSYKIMFLSVDSLDVLIAIIAILFVIFFFAYLYIDQII